jgi:hypothetical protein
MAEEVPQYYPPSRVSTTIGPQAAVLSAPLTAPHKQLRRRSTIHFWQLLRPFPHTDAVVLLLSFRGVHLARYERFRRMTAEHHIAMSLSYRTVAGLWRTIAALAALDVT